MGVRPSARRGSLSRQFGVASLDGLGLGTVMPPRSAPPGRMLRYLRELQPGGVPHLARRRHRARGRYGAARRHDAAQSRAGRVTRGGQAGGTLLDVLDDTLTPMGARLLRQWLLAPLTDRRAIERRLAPSRCWSAIHWPARPSEARSMGSATSSAWQVRRPRSVRPRESCARSATRSGGSAVRPTPSARIAREAPRADAGVFEETLSAWDDCADIGEPIRRMLVERAAHGSR